MNDFWQTLLLAFSLMLVLEGVVPFLYPQRWRRMVAQLAQVSDSNMRVLGLISMLLGLLVMWLVR